MTFHILGMSSFQLTFIFFGGVGIPPTRYIYTCIMYTWKIFKRSYASKMSCIAPAPFRPEDKPLLFEASLKSWQRLLVPQIFRHLSWDSTPVVLGGFLRPPNPGFFCFRSAKDGEMALCLGRELGVWLDG